MKPIRMAFCWLYAQWLSKLVDDKTDPLVRAIDFIAGSGCKYCMAARMFFVGFGIALWSWVGLGLITLAFLMTLGERHWLCEPTKETS